MPYGPEHPNARQTKLTEDEWKDMHDRWLDVVRRFRDWTDADIQEGARYLQANQIEPIDYIRSKLSSSARLVVIGMTHHPHFDHLPFDLMESIPGLKFICIEELPVKDYSGDCPIEIRGEDGYTTYYMDGKKAKKRFPQQYDALLEEEEMKKHAFDNVVADARDRGIDVVEIPNMHITHWAIGRIPQRLVLDYMEAHPDARGIYFGSLFSAMRWPGYEWLDGRDKPDFQKPLTQKRNIFGGFLGNLNEESPTVADNVMSPAYAAEERFPGQVYTTAQFVMPRGYGDDWDNLRLSVQASGITDRFALASLIDSPFATEGHIVRGEMGLYDIPDEELYKLFGTDAQMFFGPVSQEWSRVLDGLIIYPSDQPIPRRPTIEELRSKTLDVVKETLNDLGV